MSVAEIEQLATAAFGAQGSDRAAANTALTNFTNNYDSISQCFAVIQQSSNNYALSLALTTLIKLVPEHWNKLGDDAVLEMRNSLVSLLLTRSTVSGYILSSLLTLLCRITVIGWSRDDRHKAFASQIQEQFIRGNHPGLGLQILTELVVDVNQRSAHQSVDEFSSTNTGFKNSDLLGCFSAGLSALSQGTERTRSLELLRACLTYRWYGITTDVTRDYLSSIRVPDSWEKVLQDPSTLQLVFATLASSSGEDAETCLEVLVCLASVRQTLFKDDKAHAVYLQTLLSGCVHIIQNSSTFLTTEGAYTHFSRMLVALKSTYRIDQLGKLAAYDAWVSSIAVFTETTFNQWDSVGASASHYLLSLWANITYALGYSSPKYLELLDRVVPQVAQAYISTRILALGRAVDADDTDEFFTDAAMEEHLHQLPVLCRKKYPEFVGFFAAQVSPLLEEYPRLLNTRGADLRHIEATLAWWIRIIGCIVSTYGSSKGQARLDAELLWRVFLVCGTSNTRLRAGALLTPAARHLDLALTRLFRCFFDNYLVPAKTPEIFESLAARLGPVDKPLFLSSILEKLVLTLEVWTADEAVLTEALDLLEKIAGDSTCRALLPDLAVAQSLVTHGPQHLAFLHNPALVKLRSKFFYFWAVMVFAQGLSFQTHMAPLASRLEAVVRLLDSGRALTPESTLEIVTLYRDLRGVVAATSTPFNEQAHAFEAFFHWFKEKGMLLTRELLARLAAEPAVTTPVLRFYTELVYNYEGRVSFPAFSADGLALLKYACGTLNAYCTALRALPPCGPEKIYRHRLKGVYLSLIVLQRGLSGGYASLGALAMYGDTCVGDAASALLGLCLSGEFDEILAHSKIKQAYFALLETLAKVYPLVLSVLPLALFQAVLHTLVVGMRSFEVKTSTHAAEALNALLFHVCSRKFRPYARVTEEDAQLAAHIDSSKEILVKALSTIFHCVLFDNEDSLRQFSQCLVTLVCFHRDVFVHLRDTMVAAQPPVHQEPAYTALNKLLADVDKQSNPLDQDTRSAMARGLFTVRKELSRYIVNRFDGL